MALNSKTGATVQEVRDWCLNGLPVEYKGEDVPEFMIEQMIRTAENMLEKQFDILLSVRTVYCTGDLDDSEVTDDRILLPAFNKPANWFQGNRYGIIKVTKRPLKKVHRMYVKPMGFYRDREFDIDPRNLRIHKSSIQVVPGATGLIFGQNQLPAAAIIAVDGQMIPGGIGVIYDAGLSPREVNEEYPMLKTLALIQASILTLTFVQGRVGGGLQKEAVRVDGLDNVVEVGRREKGGPLAGEIRTLKEQYQAISSLMMADTNYSWVFLQG